MACHLCIGKKADTAASMNRLGVRLAWLGYVCATYGYNLRSFMSDSMVAWIRMNDLSHLSKSNAHVGK